MTEVIREVAHPSIIVVLEIASGYYAVCHARGSFVLKAQRFSFLYIDQWLELPEHMWFHSVALLVKADLSRYFEESDSY